MMDAGDAGRRREAAPRPDGASAVAAGKGAVEEQRHAVRRMFDRVSGRYDLLNRILSFGLDRRWRGRAIRAMEIRPGDRVLDVACGTADLSLEAAMSPHGGKVVGLDFSRPMLLLAARKSALRDGRGEVGLIEGAAERLPVRSGAFGAAGIAFGIRNVPDRIGALREMARAVRPGGKVVVLEFTPGGGSLLDAPVRFYLGRILPVIGGILSSRGAYRYLRDSTRSFPGPEEFRREMEEAGLAEIRYTRLPPAPTWLFVGTVSP